MVGREKEYSVVLTQPFLEDLETCIDYIAFVLKSPRAAFAMYASVKEKVMALSEMPEAAISYKSKRTGKKRYKISYHKYDIHYAIEGNVVRVLGIKHQARNNNQID